jgi:hypothetical protein
MSGTPALVDMAMEFATSSVTTLFPLLSAIARSAGAIREIAVTCASWAWEWQPLHSIATADALVFVLSFTTRLSRRVPGVLPIAPTFTIAPGADPVTRRRSPVAPALVRSSGSPLVDALTMSTSEIDDPLPISSWLLVFRWITGRPVPGCAAMTVPSVWVLIWAAKSGYEPPNSQTTLSSRVVPEIALAIVQGAASVHGAPVVPAGLA